MCLNGNGIIFQTRVTITMLVRSQQNRRAVKMSMEGRPVLTSGLRGPGCLVASEGPDYGATQLAK